MKKLIILTALMMGIAFPALATNPVSCERSQQQNEYRCKDDNGKVYKVSNVADADAAATAVAAQLQGQEQGQSQTSDNSNSNVNGGNSVNIEGSPAHTTSLGLGVNLGISVPVNQGFVGRQRQSEADWWMSHGQSCMAFAIMSKSRFANGVTFNCGDKG